MPRTAPAGHSPASRPAAHGPQATSRAARRRAQLRGPFARPSPRWCNRWCNGIRDSAHPLDGILGCGFLLPEWGSGAPPLSTCGKPLRPKPKLVFSPSHVHLLPPDVPLPRIPNHHGRHVPPQVGPGLECAEKVAVSTLQPALAQPSRRQPGLVQRRQHPPELFRLGEHARVRRGRPSGSLLAGVAHQCLIGAEPLAPQTQVPPLPVQPRLHLPAARHGRQQLQGYGRGRG